MQIKLKRKTGWRGSARKIKIYLDGQEGDSIKGNETLTVALPEREPILCVRQGGVKSEEIKVRDGDVIRIAMNGCHR